MRELPADSIDFILTDPTDEPDADEAVAQLSLDLA